MRDETETHTERLIKRYENRKLYDSATRRYITLEGLTHLIGQGHEVRVVDHKNGEDFTTIVLAQIILEGIKERTTHIPQQVLMRLIRFGFRKAPHLREWTSPHEAITWGRSEAEKIVKNLLGRGRLTLEEGLSVRQEITDLAHRMVHETQRSLEMRMRKFLDGAERDGIKLSLQTLKERLMSFETYLSQPKREPKVPTIKPRLNRPNIAVGTGRARRSRGLG